MLSAASLSTADHGLHRWIGQQRIPAVIPRQTMNSAGGIQPFPAGMPQRHGPQIGIGMKSWQVHLLAETKAGDCHADRLKAHISC